MSKYRPPTPVGAVFIPAVTDYGHRFSVTLRWHSYRNAVYVNGLGHPKPIMEHILLIRFWRHLGAL